MRLKSVYIVLGIALVIFGITYVVQNNFSIKTIVISTKNPKVRINSAEFNVMLAVTQAEHEQGLSDRPSLPKDQGMYFIFDKPGRNYFWMHRMMFPLDMIFIANNKVSGVYENLPPIKPNDKNPPLYGGDVMSDRVLEINAGLAKKYNIKAGDAVVFEANGSR